MKPKIGISIGDINGIGLEVILKTIENPKITEMCTPVIYGSSKVVSYHKNIVGIQDFVYNSIRGIDQIDNDKINIINCWQDNVNIMLGKVNEVGGQYAFKSLEAAVIDLKKGAIDALVTAPINKKAMQMAGFPFPGHTEYITQELGVKQSVMLMLSDNLRVGLVTNHLPLKDVAAAITKELIIRKATILRDALKIDFGIEKPTIAILGLNPHAGDEGVLGQEEEAIIRPAIEELKHRGIMAFGPYAADGFFGSGQYKKFDATLAMYHDQGLVPFKTLSFGDGVNYTAGLSGIRTSPDHGTGFDIVGKNEADPSSFRKALFVAIDAAKHRAEYIEMHADPVYKKAKNITESSVDEVLRED